MHGEKLYTSVPIKGYLSKVENYSGITLTS